MAWHLRQTVFRLSSREIGGHPKAVQTKFTQGLRFVFGDPGYQQSEEVSSFGSLAFWNSLKR
jgi:hypothetical protein